MAKSGKFSPQGFNIAGRKWKGFSSVSKEEDAGNVLLLREVVWILEEEDGVDGVLTKEEMVFVAIVTVVSVLLLVEELTVLALVLLVEPVLFSLALILLSASLRLVLELVVVELMLELVVVVVELVLVSGGCMVLTDASGWTDIGQLCSVYGACPV